MADYLQPRDPNLERLGACTQEIEKIREICEAPSLSFGVIHQGQVILKQSIGHRDASKSLPVDPETIYIIGSCSKMFLAAALGILVDEGKIRWQDPIQKYIPEFDPVGDPQIGQKADIIDCMRHTTGLKDAIRLILGPSGSVLIDEENHVPLLNLMSTSGAEGQRFNREWDYNNAVVGLLALVVQQVTGQRYADFWTGLISEGDDNVADACAVMSNGTVVKALETSWPGKNYPALVSATGMRSTLNDLLTWCLAVLAAERSERDSNYAGLSHNPLKQVNRVRRGYWTRPADDPEFSKASVYGMGWVGMKLPSSMLGAFGGNLHSREKDHQVHLQNIMGKDSQPDSMVMIGHTGGVKGMVTTLWTFPETQSAVVAIANARDFGDASDFTAQLLIQSLFDLKPRLDLVPWALKERELARSYFQRKMAQPWIDNRCSTDPKRDPKCYAGQYRGFNGLLAISIVGDSQANLSVVFNNCPGSKLPLLFYKKDVYSYFDPDEDTWKRQSSWPVSYQQVLLAFEVDELTSKATNLRWQWDMDLEPALFCRID
ncbi:hypothetical protein N7468_007238 [Penicillium chermesinum]|uniref:Beta-lactamase-related domain-containing protein n=1 Tax=Penicillium chermesinum TaxID=63820 RepID=A0A9W9NW48_9EURO|nr:uncharacterized protein N7468_007238 [Penicillium chermesinum]KAJ5226013.1 hypothetical protein N7468_007238 [Penicillium chermesinum]